MMAFPEKVLPVAVITPPPVLCKAADPFNEIVLAVTSTTDPAPVKPLWLMPGLAYEITQLLTVNREPFWALMPLPAFQMRTLWMSPTTVLPLVVLVLMPAEPQFVNDEFSTVSCAFAFAPTSMHVEVKPKISTSSTCTVKADRISIPLIPVPIPLILR